MGNDHFFLKKIYNNPSTPLFSNQASAPPEGLGFLSLEPGGYFPFLPGGKARTKGKEGTPPKHPLMRSPPLPDMSYPISFSFDVFLRLNRAILLRTILYILLVYPVLSN